MRVSDSGTVSDGGRGRDSRIESARNRPIPILSISNNRTVDRSTDVTIAPVSNVRVVADALARFYGPLPQPPDDPFGVYVWEVFGVRNTPGRREAAVAALRRIPALTPDALARLPQAKIEAVLALAGPLHEERHRALCAGIDLFRRHPDLVTALCGPLREAARAARRLPHLGVAAAHRVLLFGGHQPIAAPDEAAARVLVRLGAFEAARLPLRAARRAIEAAAGLDTAALERLSLCLSHHGLSTCLAAAPHCRICPVAARCACAGSGAPLTG